MQLSKPNLPSSKPCLIIGFSCLFFVIVGILLTTVAHDLLLNYLNDQIASTYVLDSPSATGFSKWANPNGDDPNADTIYTDFYVYNFTNPEEILAGGMPIVQEIGPLRYNFHFSALNATWDPSYDGDVVEFLGWEWYVPDDATSVMQGWNITTLNVPLLGMMHAPAAALLGPLLIDYIKGVYGPDFPNALFLQKTIGETIWGWHDPLLAELSLFGVPSQYPGLQANDTTAEVATARHKRGSMYTGKVTTNLAREYIVWDGMETVECCPYGPCGDTATGSPPAAPWTTTEALEIRGSFGDQFHPGLSQDENVFVSTHSMGIYRHWEMASTSTEVVKGITLNRYVWLDGTLGNASVDASAAAAYTNFGPSGLLNQSQCEWGAPIFLGSPHFYGVSEQYLGYFQNLSLPDASVDETYIGVEPYTGTTMDFHWRVGIYLNVVPTDLFGSIFFENVSSLIPYFPIASADRYGGVSDSQAAQYQSTVGLATKLIAAFRWGGIALAVVCLGLAIASFIFASQRRAARTVARELDIVQWYQGHYGIAAVGAGVGASSINDPLLSEKGGLHTREASAPLMGALPPSAFSNAFPSVSRSLNS